MIVAKVSPWPHPCANGTTNLCNGANYVQWCTNGTNYKTKIKKSVRFHLFKCLFLKSQFSTSKIEKKNGEKGNYPLIM